MNAKETLDLRITELNNSCVAVVKATLAGLRMACIIQSKVDRLSDSVGLSIYTNSFYIAVDNRDDLQVLLELAPKWEKSHGSASINYTADVEDAYFNISATDGALPDTCKLVEKDVIIPAQPERIEKRMVVECVQPSEPPADSFSS